MNQGDKNFREKLAAYNKLVYMNQASAYADHVLQNYDPVKNGPQRPLWKYEFMQEMDKGYPIRMGIPPTAGKYIQRGLAEAYANPSAYTPYVKQPSFLDQLFSIRKPKPDASFTSEGLRNLGKAARQEDNRMQTRWGDVPSSPRIPSKIFFDR